MIVIFLADYDIMIAAFYFYTFSQYNLFGVLPACGCTIQFSEGPQVMPSESLPFVLLFEISVVVCPDAMWVLEKR